MSLFQRHAARTPDADPFGERAWFRYVSRKRLLGGRFRFETDSRALLALVEGAYGRLPQPAWPEDAPEFRVELRLLPGRGDRPHGAPAPVRTQSGAGLLCGIMDESNYAIVAPAQRRAVVAASEDMLDHAYHVRYELIEFAVFLLAARGMNLMPLHGACVGRSGKGVLVLGESGAGKSTLVLHGYLRELELLSEDAVFIRPRDLHAVGVANYLHVRPDALRFIDDDRIRRWIRQSPLIRRRSGIEKYEADPRRGSGRIAASSKLAGVVFVSKQPCACGEPQLGRMPADEVAERLRADQPYAAGQPGWDRFVDRLARLGVYRLCRGRHPADAVDALRQLLDADADAVSLKPSLRGRRASSSACPDHEGRVPI